METKSPETVIVYNKLNLAAVISTAIVLSEFPGAKSFDVSQLVPVDSVHYIWIGVDPKNNVAEFYRQRIDQQHTIVLEDAPPEPLRIQLHPFKTKFPEEQVSGNVDDLHFKATLIDKTCKTFGFENDDYAKLDFHVARFYGRKTEIEFLAFVYANLIHAEKCITDELAFSLKSTTAEDIDLYMQDIRRVRSVFASGFRHTTILDGEKVRPAVHTSISDFSFHLVLRLTKLVHANFVNMTMGMSGAIAYTNMRHIVFDKKTDRPLVVN